MTQEDALTKIQDILQTVTGMKVTRSGAHWRGINLGRGMTLSVDVFAGRGWDGHMRVHVWPMNPDDPAVRVHDGAPTTPPAVGKCGKCKLSPSANPGFYRGERGGGYRISMARGEEPSSADLDQLTEAVRWLWQRFGQ